MPQADGQQHTEPARHAGRPAYTEPAGVGHPSCRDGHITYNILLLYSTPVVRLLRMYHHSRGREHLCALDCLVVENMLFWRMLIRSACTVDCAIELQSTPYM
jgi:hypothetical protein